MSRNQKTTNQFLRNRSLTLGTFLAIVLAATPFIGFAQTVESARADSFMRMDGDRTFMRFHGRVLRPEGCPGVPVNVQSRIEDQVKVAMKGDRFDFEIEVTSGINPGLRLLAVTSDKKWMGAKTIGQYEFRQAAIDGIELELEPVRQIDIRVADQGKVVSDANVIVEGAFGFNIETTTNETGIATVSVPESSEIYNVSAWTDDFRIGGYSLQRTPIRDQFARELQIDLSPCRRQRVRSVDADGEPIADLPIKIEVATKPPHYNYIPRYERCELTTGANGEIEDLWFPDWEQFHFNVDSRDPNWFVAKEATIEDGVLVAHFAKSPKRKRVNGRLKISSSMEGGFFVRLGTFEHPEESRYDLIFARTDAEGRFHLNVLPGATYCIFVDDAKWISDYWTGILVDAESGDVNEPLLKLSRGPKIEFQVTQGLGKSPVPNLPIHVGSSHRFTWMENGRESSGNLGPRKWVTTDENGMAKLRGPVGKMKAYISLPYWNHKSRQLSLQVR